VDIGIDLSNLVSFLVNELVWKSFDLFFPNIQFASFRCKSSRQTSKNVRQLELHKEEIVFWQHWPVAMLFVGFVNAITCVSKIASDFTWVTSWISAHAVIANSMPVLCNIIFAWFNWWMFLLAGRLAVCSGYQVADSSRANSLVIIYIRINKCPPEWHTLWRLTVNLALFAHKNK